MYNTNSTSSSTGNTNGLNCNRNMSTISQIRSVLESGDVVECSGCPQFVYRNGICGCKHLNH